MRAQLGFLALLLTLASAFGHLDRPRPVVSLHGVKLGMTRLEVVALLGEPCFGAQDLAAYDSDLEVGFEDGRVTWVVGFSLQVGGWLNRMIRTKTRPRSMPGCVPGWGPLDGFLVWSWVNLPIPD